MNKSDLRARLLNNSRAFRTRTITVDGDGTQVDVRSLSAGQAFHLQEQSRVPIDDDDPKAGTKVEDKLFYPALVIAAAYVPGTQDQIFTETDRDGVLAMPWEQVELIAQAILAISGLTGAAVEALEKNFGAAGPTPPAAVSSDSPSASA